MLLFFKVEFFLNSGFLTFLYLMEWNISWSGFFLNMFLTFFIISDFFKNWYEHVFNFLIISHGVEFDVSRSLSYTPPPPRYYSMSSAVPFSAHTWNILNIYCGRKEKSYYRFTTYMTSISILLFRSIFTQIVLKINVPFKNWHSQKWNNYNYYGY